MNDNGRLPGRPITGIWQHYERSMQAPDREPWTPEMREAIACAFFMGAEAVVNLLNASRDDMQSPWHLQAALDGLQADIDEVIVNVGDPVERLGPGTAPRFESHRLRTSSWSGSPGAATLAVCGSKRVKRSASRNRTEQPAHSKTGRLSRAGGSS